MYYRFTDSSHVVTEPKPQVFNSHQHFFQKKGATASRGYSSIIFLVYSGAFIWGGNEPFFSCLLLLYPFFMINKVFNSAIKFFLHFTDLSHKKGKFILAPKLVVGMVIILLTLEKNRWNCNNTVSWLTDCEILYILQFKQFNLWH